MIVNNLLARVQALLASTLGGRGRAVTAADGSIFAVISSDPADPSWLIAPFDDPDALVLLGGCGVRLGLLTNSPTDPTDLVDQVLGVLDGNLTEYLQLDERGACSVGYTHTYSGGRSSWGVTRPGPGIVAVRYPAWHSQREGTDEHSPSVDDSARAEQSLQINTDR